MAYLRTTGDDDTEISTSYSTLFSNKLIDLAISVDTEVLTKCKAESECIGNGKAGILDVSNSLVITKENTMGADRRKYGTEFPSANPRQPVTNGLLQSAQPNLLTVFSSPCADYFPNSNRTSPEDSDEELPEYVRSMMEYDVTLQRLVKTGSVTISKVKQETRSSGKEKCLHNGEEDYAYDGDEIHNGIEQKNSNVPPGNIHEWQEFPFAKRLLELAHMSLTPNAVRDVVSQPLPAQGIVKKTLPLQNPIRGSTLPKSSISTGFINGLSQAKPMKSQKQIRKLRPKEPSSVVKAAQPKLAKKIPVIGNSKAPSRKNSEVEEDDRSNVFQMDPMKFLEVSLKEGKVPDDSHRRKYECKFCEKKFCWSTDLKRHTLIHTGERPFQCPECPANFTRKFLMQKHMKKVHGEDSRRTASSNADAAAEEDFYSVATFVQDESGDELDGHKIKTEFNEEEFEDFDMGDDEEYEEEVGVKYIDF